MTVASPVVDARRWGATSSALQSAIDSLPATGGTVLLGENITCTDTVTLDNLNSVTLKGMGRLTTKLQPDTSFAAKPVLKLIACRSCNIEDMWIAGNAATPPLAAVNMHVNTGHTEAAMRNTITRCRIGDSFSNAMVNGVTWTADVDHNNDMCKLTATEFYNLTNAALRISHSNSLWQHIDNCTFNDRTVPAFRFEGGSANFTSCNFLGPLAVFNAGTYRHTVNFVDCNAELTTAGPYWLHVDAAADTVKISIKGGSIQGGAPSAAHINWLGENGQLYALGADMNSGQAATTAEFIGANTRAAFTNCLIGLTGMSYNSILEVTGGRHTAGTVTYTNLGAGTLIRRIQGGGHSGTNMAGVTSITMSEQADPAAPAANQAVLYCRDNGSGKTQLVALFPSGAAQTIATEP